MILLTVANVVDPKVVNELTWTGIMEGFLGNLIYVVFGFILAFLYRWARKKSVQYQVNIAGDYLSTYEDIVNGETVTKSAPVTLNQKGNDVSGITFLDNKKWKIEGELSHKKYFYGMYYSIVTEDSGRGNFFLQIDKTHDRKVMNLNGIWSGYDSDNNMITSGSYNFKRLARSEIVKASQNAATRIVEIAGDQLGKDYLSIENLDFDKNVILKALVNSETVGFSINSTLNVQEFRNEFPNLINILQATLDQSKTVGIIRTIAVDKEYQKRGLGNALLTNSVSELMKNSDFIMMVAWKSDIKVNIQALAETHGFRKVKEIPNYWNVESKKKKYSCPICGEPPCQCSAVVFTKVIEKV